MLPSALLNRFGYIGYIGYSGYNVTAVTMLQEKRGG